MLDPPSIASLDEEHRMGPMDEKTVERLKELGHEIGNTGMSHDGKLLIGVDGRMMTYPEIDKLLDDDLKKTTDEPSM